jgi:hypothetical protein
MFLSFCIACVVIPILWLNRTNFRIYRQFKGGIWNKVWYNRQIQGGFEIWENFTRADYDSVNGRVIETENYNK